MKRIVVWHRCGMTELLDDDNSDRQDYAHKLSSVFKLNEIAIINTSDNTFIARPSDISGIQVSSERGFDVGDLEDHLDEAEQLNKEIDKTLKPKESESEKKEKVKKDEEEILTDM